MCMRRSESLEAPVTYACGRSTGTPLALCPVPASEPQFLSIHPQEIIHVEASTEGFHPDRIDDRRRDHRHLAAIALPAYQDYTIRAQRH